MTDNTSTFVGNLTAAPELRYTQSGLAVANFTVAVQDRKFDKAKNEYVDGDTLFMRCSLWREFAEHVAALDKGTRVIVTGKLKQRSYETTSGEKRTSIELEVDAIGPDLRYATAQVTRAASSGATSGQQGRQNAQQQEPWANSAPSPQNGTQGGADRWNSAQGVDDSQIPF
jgi:single-strand DNA-binding protein